MPAETIERTRVVPHVPLAFLKRYFLLPRFALPHLLRKLAGRFHLERLAKPVTRVLVASMATLWRWRADDLFPV